jgi:hypothetical protein
VTDLLPINTMTNRDPTTEESPLLPPPDSEVSSETLAETEEGRSQDLNAANQSVGTLRAVLIILSSWVLIFFQGPSYPSELGSPKDLH